MARDTLAWLFAAVTLTLPSCLGPQSPAQRVTDAARELNIAARFGRMDLAAGRTANGARSRFLERRANWGKELRVVDVELTGMSMSDAHQALILVDVDWVRMSEGSLRSTRVAQTWRDDDDGWQLVREQRVAGDLGLFGERVDIQRPESQDVHFPTKTIY